MKSDSWLDTLKTSVLNKFLFILGQLRERKRDEEEGESEEDTAEHQQHRTELGRILQERKSKSPEKPETSNPQTVVEIQSESGKLL